MSSGFENFLAGVAQKAHYRRDEAECICPPCPGRGNDGHGMTHCAECCFGTGVEVDWDCPIHGPGNREREER